MSEAVNTKQHYQEVNTMTGQQQFDIKLLSSLLSGFKIRLIKEQEDGVQLILENKNKQTVFLKAEIAKDKGGKDCIHLSVYNL